jgi:regulator of RNase E activity RraA
LTYQSPAVSKIETTSDALSGLSTPQIADACQRLNIGLRVAPAGIRPLRPGQRLVGRALPLRFNGSIDIFLEALDRARRGDVLVVDNKGRSHEACLSRLIVLEAMSADVTGAVLWGAHRDADALRPLEFAVFSYGTFPRGAQQVRDRHPESLVSARFGTAFVTSNDIVIADEDGVIFVPAVRLSQVLEGASSIAAIERDQTDRMHRGTSLRDQLAFSQYLALRREDPTYTLRKHLRGVGVEV